MKLPAGAELGKTAFIFMKLNLYCCNITIPSCYVCIPVVPSMHASVHIAYSLFLGDKLCPVTVMVTDRDNLEILYNGK